jgi:hypothetical protein
MSSLHKSSFSTVVALLLSLATAGAAQATTWSVPGDMSNTCSIATPSCDTIAGAIAASVAGDTIDVAAGTHSESNLLVDKALTVQGVGVTTIVDAGGLNAFLIRADDVTVQNLRIQNCADGVRLETTIDSPTVNGVLVEGFTSDGIEISGNVTNASVTDSQIRLGVNGIRMSSGSQVTGLAVTDTLIQDNTGSGIYQANDANTSRLSGLNVSGSTFDNNGDGGGESAIYAEEMAASDITGNTFTDNYRGILLFKGYSTSGVDMGDITIAGNEFVDSDTQAVEIVITATAAGADIIVENNTITQDVGVLDFTLGLIDIRLKHDLSHQPIKVRNNDVLLSGTFGVATAVHGVMVRGNGPVEITGNILAGGGVGGPGTQPPTSGIFIRTVDSFANYGTIPASAVLTASCNRIEGFVNGVSVYDAVGLAYGGLLAGATFTVENNSISGNSGDGVVNGPSTTVDAENNFWGCETGPGTGGCDTITGDVDADPFLVEAAACTACLDDADCDDGLACNGSETCALATNMCQSGTAVVCTPSTCHSSACEEPGNCVETPLGDGEPCNDGVTCSIDATCQSGLCEGGGTDGDMSGTCDEDEFGALTVVTASMKAQKPAAGNGKAATTATFVTDPPTDTFDASAPITVSIEDAAMTKGERTFATSECTNKRGKITCKAADKTGSALFKPNPAAPGAFSMKARLKGLAIDGMFSGPVRVTLTYGPGSVRLGAIGTCVSKATSIKCK